MRNFNIASKKIQRTLLIFSWIWLSIQGFSQNPIVKDMGLNDPHIHIFNDTAYVYASHDKSIENKSFIMEDWWIWSSPDLVNWKKESVLKPEDTYIGKPFTGCWATDVGRRNGKYYWYFSEKNQQAGVVVGREARLRGMHMCHSPEADIVRDPRFGRMSEAFGEDTYLTTEMVVNAVKGVQGNYEGLGKGTHIGAVAKHFAGYGQILGGTNFSAIEISPRTLIDEIYPPFQGAVQRARSLGIMDSHGDLNGIASHSNPELLTGLLRDQWGFEGYVVSDANDVARLHYFMKVAETPEEAAIMGLTAGVDIDLYSDDAYALLPEIVKTRPDKELKRFDLLA